LALIKVISNFAEHIAITYYKESLSTNNLSKEDEYMANIALLTDGSDDIDCRDTKS
jgi:hypothetical protein